jgi:TRAP-type C4-dicarboxylate transport system substrate-binding protein
VTNEFGVGLDKIFVNQGVYDGLDPELRQVLDDTYAELAPTLMIERAITQGERDIETWRGENGPDSVITLDSAEIRTLMEPLGRELAEQVFGPGAYEIIRGAA